ncbi:tRNA(Met) cytidine acetyltransferase TmcA [Halospeciosus flavus]|uniref:tRNA(Met) cytidine acetyltransferase TmcA n=1 Tax=Halospeciosus flavus TaxID=3032283 RepID=A0ABD5Z281_9EURY|nr:tRNA(Met) cytidine acetyltransferase TmcA [Halospeciosus flavus]
MLRDVASALREEAQSVNERRLLVLAGDRSDAYDDVATVLDATDLDPAETTLVAHEDTDAAPLTVERVTPRGAGALLGRTRDAVVYDAREECRPNALGRVAGAVDGGGLLVLLTPPLDEWPDRRDRFDEGMAVPPFDVDDVTGRFRDRLVETLHVHRGVAIVDRDASGDGEYAVVDDGLTDPAPRFARPEPESPDEHAFPDAAYDACRTPDQVDAVRAFEALRDQGHALVVEADRGRGKSSAAGIAAACLAAEGQDVLVTAPQYRSAAEVFARAREVLDALDALVGSPGENPRELRADAGGRLRFADPPEAADLPDDPDTVLVDEAAALPVRLLDAFLDAPRAAFTTTVHGYEGAGRGFDVRFRDHLAESDFEVRDVTLDDPIRYAAGDPVEVWAFRALLLDARPPVDPLVDAADPDSVTFTRLTPDALRADEHLLRETFGLLVYAHYRTEPNDLARVLDAPNLSLSALRHEGHVVSVAMLAREGGLDAETRAGMYEGERVKGNMIPDVLTSQLRDESAADPVGFRVVRIATHHAARSRGLGSRLLADCRETVGERGADWFGVGYGATPDLLDFWSRNGFSTVHLSTTRNDTSGEYSAVMLDPLTSEGRRLHGHHAGWFADRVGGVLADALDDLDPDVARAALAACDAEPDPDLSPWQWRVVADAAYGPGLYSVDPEPFRRLAVAALVRDDAPDLSARRERLFVLSLLQHRSWDDVADKLDYHSTGRAMRDLGDALAPLVDAFGDETAREERARFASGDAEGES